MAAASGGGGVGLAGGGLLGLGDGGVGGCGLGRSGGGAGDETGGGYASGLKMLLQLALVQNAPGVCATRAQLGPTGTRAVPLSSLTPLPAYISTVALAAC
jgi:hypothetical protein